MNSNRSVLVLAALLFFAPCVRAQPVDGRFPIYGLIYDIHIDDDPVVQRLVLAENPPTEVIEDQRQNRLRPIEMSVLAVGYGESERIVHGLPPRPPLNLDPVLRCHDIGCIVQDKVGFLEFLSLFYTVLRGAGDTTFHGNFIRDQFPVLGG